MTAIGQGFAMRVQLARLCAKHNVVATPVSIPLAPPSDGPIIVEGIAASATTIDLTRMLFRKYAFPLPTFSWDKTPPLRYRHGAEDVGEIEALHYDRDGSLRVRARVDLPQARRCSALSICAKVLDYEIINKNSADFHAIIKRAEILEISLTDQPCCPAALIDFRGPVPAHREFFKNAKRGIEILQEMITVIGREIDRTAADQRKAAPAPPLEQTTSGCFPKVPARPPVESHRASDFGRLISAIEANHAAAP